MKQYQKKITTPSDYQASDNQNNNQFKQIRQQFSDSIGNNSGGRQFSRDSDFNMMDQNYEQQIQQRANITMQKMQIQAKQPQISLNDIQSKLNEKFIQLNSYKKCLQTLLQYSNAFTNDQLTKHIKTICSLVSFDITFRRSSSPYSQYVFPLNGLQQLICILTFLSHLIQKCCQLQSNHLYSLIQQIVNLQSRLFQIPLQPLQFMQLGYQFLQSDKLRDTNQQKTVKQIQQAYGNMFQYGSDVTQIHQLFYYYFATKVYKTVNKSQINEQQLTMKDRIHSAKMLQSLNYSSTQLYKKYGFNKEQQNLLTISKAKLFKLPNSQLQQFGSIVYEFSCKNQQFIKKYFFIFIQPLVNQQCSIQKKSLALKLIEKLIINTKTYPQIIQAVSSVLQELKIIDLFLKDQTHNQLLKKLPQIVRFLYQLDKISMVIIKKLIKQSLTSHEQFHKIIHTLIQSLRLKHLQQVFNMLTTQSDLLNNHTSSLFYALVNNNNLAVLKRKKKNKKDPKKNSQNELRKNSQVEKQCYGTQLANNQESNSIVYALFAFLLKLVQQSKYQQLYINSLNKLLTLQIHTLLPVLQTQLLNRLSKPSDYKTYLISIIQNCLKIDMESQSQKKHNSESNKYRLIKNLVHSCSLLDSMLISVANFRFNSIICQKCINIFILYTKSYQPLQRHQTQLLWRILGLHSSTPTQKQQFFSFLKQVLKNPINLTQSSVKYIYFQIILKLHHSWFSSKIQDCFQLLFMRLNQDGRMLIYQDGGYHLKKTELVGIEKFYYLYFWADHKVSKKVKQFLVKIYNYKMTPEVKTKLSNQIITSIIKYLQRDPQTQDHILHASRQEDIQQHINRAFQLLGKFSESSKFNNLFNDQSNEQNKIILYLNNTTKQALPPLKKTIQVNKKMLLKQLYQIVGKQINPPLQKIQLISKGITLKFLNIPLHELNLQSKNTISIQNIPQQIDFNQKQYQHKNQSLTQVKQKLYQFFGHIRKDVVDFIVQKYQGQVIDKICEIIMDQDVVKTIQLQIDSIKQHHNVIIQQQNQQQQQQLLNFDQLLSKRIYNLIQVIDNKDSVKSINKKWSIIKKIPANNQLLQSIQTQINKPQANWQQFFKHFQLNNQAYALFLLKRLVLTKNSHLLKLKSNTQFQRYLLFRLQTLINQNVYHSELYGQLFEVLQMLSSLKLLINQRQFLCDSMISNINQIIIKQKDYLINTNVRPHMLSMKSSEKAIQILLYNTVDEEIAYKIYNLILISTLVSSIDSQYERHNIAQKLNYNYCFKLLEQYKQSFLKFYLSCVIINKSTSRVQDCQQYYQGFLFFQQKVQQSITNILKNSDNREWLYYLLIGFIQLIDQSCVMQQFYRISLKWMIILQNNAQFMSRAELSGILSLIRYLIEKIINFSQNLAKKSQNNRIFSQTSIEIFSFIKFLSKKFIFNIKSIPILTDKHIKHQFYYILTLLSSRSIDYLCFITEKLIDLGVDKRNHDHDTIDFRTGDFVGIQNLGSTCYINSLIQQLYHTKLPLNLLKMQQCQGLFQLEHSFMQLYMSRKNIINLLPMIKLIKFHGQQINPFIQQDAQQFLMSLLQYIESCQAKPIVDQIFGGSFSQQLTYLVDEKKFIKHKVQHFYNITLDIKGKRNLQQALVYFFRSQTLDDKIQCEELAKMATVIKKSYIKHYPNILIFTLKRFQYEMETRTRNKLNDYIEFPMHLNLSQFSLENILKKQQNLIRIQVQQPSSQRHQLQQYLYSLSGILIHSGSATTGHYYSYIKRGQKWYQFNDRNVVEINIYQRIKGQCFGGQSKSRNAYMLFYQKFNKQSISQQLQLNDSRIQIEQVEMSKKVIHGNQASRYHGIFLDQVPQQNRLKQLVLQQNNSFIKQRLIYDPQYRKYIQLTIESLQSHLSNLFNLNQQQQSQYQYIASQLTQLKRINSIINPRHTEIVYFNSQIDKKDEGRASQETEEIRSIDLNPPVHKPFDMDQFI